MTDLDQSPAQPFEYLSKGPTFGWTKDFNPETSTNPGGSNLQIQYNNFGTFGGLTDVQLTARMQLFTSVLSGAVPASGGDPTKFLRGDGLWTVPPEIIYPQRAITTTPVTIQATDVILIVNLPSLTSINLPLSSTRGGVRLTFKNIGAGAITLVCASSEAIDTTPTLTIAGGMFQGLSIYPYNDGVHTGWFII